MFVYKYIGQWNFFSDNEVTNILDVVILNQVLRTATTVTFCFMLTVLIRSMADSAVGRSFRLVVDRVNAAALSRPAACLLHFVIYSFIHLFICLPNHPQCMIGVRATDIK